MQQRAFHDGQPVQQDRERSWQRRHAAPQRGLPRQLDGLSRDLIDRAAPPACHVPSTRGEGRRCAAMAALQGGCSRVEEAGDVCRLQLAVPLLSNATVRPFRQATSLYIATQLLCPSSLS